MRSQPLRTTAALALVAATTLLLAERPARAAELPARDLSTALRVREVLIAGNARVEADTIRSVLVTAAGTWLDRATVGADVRRVFALGFFDEVTIEIAGDPSLGVVVVTVKEKPLVRAVEIEGNEALSDEKLAEVMDLKRGEILDVPKLRRNVEKLRAKYETEGFLTAEVSVAHVPAGPGLVNVTFAVIEGAKLHVRKINFVGNVSLTDAELAEKIETRAADTLSFLNGTGKLSEEALSRDLLALTGAYYDVGHLAVKIAPPLVTLSADRTEIDVTFSIDEGRRYKVGDVGLAVDAGRGLSGVTREELYAEVGMRRGEWFSRVKLGADIERLARRLRDKGYAYSSITPLSEIERSTDTDVCRVEPEDGAR